MTDQERRGIEAPFPDALASQLERYLTHHRPFLLRRTGRWNRTETPSQPNNALWISGDGSAMTEIAIYFRIIKQTKARYGHGVNPHLFRDSAATSIAIEDPGKVLITRNILGHATLRTSEKHYNQATSLQASRQYQEQILALRGPSGHVSPRPTPGGSNNQGT